MRERKATYGSGHCVAWAKQVMRQGDTLTDGREPNKVLVGVEEVPWAYAEAAMRAITAILLANIIVEIRGSGEMVGEAVRLGERG